MRGHYSDSAVVPYPDVKGHRDPVYVHGRVVNLFLATEPRQDW